ncbi:MAG: methyl-accepting chemotaxis protein [Deferribacteraceae bacterium]|jgi:methyl-accepting chemotaxis protein|nr:methyl-accepting chemotaxis protein [Deferribacteraceae bacterium]
MIDKNKSSKVEDTGFYKRADLIMLALIWIPFVYAIGLSFWYSTWKVTFFIGGGLTLILTILYKMIAGSRLYRCFIAVGFMIMSGVHIQQSHGMVEMHFGIFLSLAFLVYYRDWLPIVVGAATIAVHHLLFYTIQLSGDTGIWVVGGTSAELGWKVIILHAAYVVAEAAVLIWLAIESKKQADLGDELRITTEQLLSGDSINLTYRNKAKFPLIRQFNALIDKLDKLVARVVEAAAELKSASARLTQTTKMLQDGSSRLISTTNDIDSAINRLTDAVGEVSSNADRASETARKADQDVDAGNQAIKATQDDIEQLSTDIEHSSTTILDLASGVQQIDEVVNVIKNVANQTNLLALNAAIEAARAGESGKGFAVVADEVRKLASQTQAATEDIQKKISNLQTQSGRAVEAMDKSRTVMEKCVENTKRTVDLLDAVQESVASIQNIGVSTRDQLAITDQVKALAATIRDIVQFTAENVEDVSMDSVRLEVLASQLEELCAEFIVTR